MLRRVGATVIAALLCLAQVRAASGSTNTWIVNSAADTSGSCTVSLCTLRSAIEASNAAGGSSTITFDIPPGGPQTISVGSSELPPITGSAVVVDGTTQPGGGAHGIRLDDPNTGDGEAGLTLQGSNITIRGLSITDFNGYGMLLSGSTGDTIAGNWIGTADGSTPAGNRNIGLMVDGGGSNTIGGTAAADSNVISATVMGWDGDGLQIHDSSNNVVIGNDVGMTADGLGRMWNADSGIEIAGASSGNRIGGLTTGERNISSGNSGMGVQLLGVVNGDGTCSAPTNNVIEGNYIGVNADGVRPGAYGNVGEGLSIDVCGRNNEIGGTSPAARNVISGNNDDGMQIDGLDGPAGGVCNNDIQGNFVGVDPTGMSAIDNGVVGIKIQNGACNTLVGGTAAGAGNVVSGNLSDAFYVRRASTNGTQIIGNIIGLGADGNQWIGGGDVGVHIFSGAQHTTVSGNVISASASEGVLIEEPSTNDNTISDNRIGTNSAATALRGNRAEGVRITNGAQSNTVSGNVVAGNGAAGIQIEQPSTSTTASIDNRITQNREWSNTGLGIDLVPVAGVNPNDGNDTNTAIGNDGMDYPVIAQATSTSAKGTAPASSTVELFAATADTGSPNGEGSTYIGTTTADGSGSWCIGGISIGGAVTATATDANGNTSEFAVNAAPSGSAALCGSPSPTPTPTATPAPTPTPAPMPSPSGSGTLFSDTFTGSDGSAPGGWQVTKSAGGSTAGAVIMADQLQVTDALSGGQDGLWEYVEARATTLQPSWASGTLTFSWQMGTAASSSQGASFILAPAIAGGNVVNAPDYLRIKVANGTLSVITRTAGGSATTLWSGPETVSGSLRQFQLQIDGSSLWLSEGPLGSTPSLRVGPLSHGLGWTTANIYLHAHNVSVATPFVVDYDTVQVQ